MACGNDIPDLQESEDKLSVDSWLPVSLLVGTDLRVTARTSLSKLFGLLSINGATPDENGSVTFASTNTLCTFNTQTASYTLALTDYVATQDKIVNMDVATANNLIVPPNSSVAFQIGCKINIRQKGVGKTTLVAGSGVTINATPGLGLRAQHSVVTLIKEDTNVWLALGDLS